MPPAVAKRITQDTFDAVVKENIEDFDMEPEEAVADAISQFESQGVDLSTISKTYGSGNRPIIDTVPKIQAALDAANADDIVTHLRSLNDEIKSDDDKQLAGTSNAVQVVCSAVQYLQADATRVLDALSALITLLTWRYNRDVLMDVGMKVVIDIVDAFKESDIAVTEKAMFALRNAQFKDENNRQDLAQFGALDRAVELIRNNPEKVKLVRVACDVIRASASNDDERAPLGKAAERARHVIELGVLPVSLDLIRNTQKDNASVISSVYAMLSKIIVTNEICQSFLDDDGLATVFESIQTHMGNVELVKNAVGLSKTLAGSDDVKSVMVAKGYINMLILILTQHSNNTGVVERALGALNFVSLRNPAACSKIAEAGGLPAIVTAMRDHPTALNVQQHACMAIRNLVVRNPENKKPILDEGAEEYINLAMQEPMNRDHAKAALRDLGCKVEFVELWKDKAIPDSMKDPEDASLSNNVGGVAVSKVV